MALSSPIVGGDDGDLVDEAARGGEGVLKGDDEEFYVGQFFSWTGLQLNMIR